MNKILENEKLQKAWIFCKLWGGRIYKFICRIIVCATAVFVLFSFFPNVFIKIYSKLFAQDEVLFAKQYRELLRLVGYILLWHLAGIRFSLNLKPLQWCGSVLACHLGMTNTTMLQQNCSTFQAAFVFNLHKNEVKMILFDR